MRAEDIAVVFSERLGKFRALTSEETDLLQAVLLKETLAWTHAEIEALKAGRRAGRPMTSLAREIGRSYEAVRSKLRQMKRKERMNG